MLPVENIQDASVSKRPRLDSRIRREFDARVARLNEWFEKTEVTLELLTEPSSNVDDQLTLEEQVVLINVSC